MTRPEKFFVACTALLCASLLAVSAIPGLLNDIVFIALIPAIVIVPIALAGFSIMLLILARRGNLSRLRCSRKFVLLCAVLILSSVTLLRFYVPRRVAFTLSRHVFERELGEDALSRISRGHFPRRIGLYQVDRVAADPRGGEYFRVYAGLDGIGPGTTSYGFAHSPNAEGSPFGGKAYRVFNLGSGWHSFRASNDWQ